MCSHPRDPLWHVHQHALPFCGPLVSLSHGFCQDVLQDLPKYNLCWYLLGFMYFAYLCIMFRTPDWSLIAPFVRSRPLGHQPPKISGSLPPFLLCAECIQYSHCFLRMACVGLFLDLSVSSPKRLSDCLRDFVLIRICSFQSWSKVWCLHLRDSVIVFFKQKSCHL